MTEKSAKKAGWNTVRIARNMDAFTWIIKSHVATNARGGSIARNMHARTADVNCCEEVRRSAKNTDVSKRWTTDCTVAPQRKAVSIARNMPV